MPASLNDSHPPDASAAHAPYTSASQRDPEHQHARLPDAALGLTGTLRLRDGAVVGVRALRPEDRQRLQELHARLSPDTIVFRFFRALPKLNDDTARHLTHLDYDGRMALAATFGQGADERLLAVVRYERINSTTAEVAFVVEDAWQGRGIATALLHLLARYARTHGFTSLVAITMGTNARMLDVLRHCGFPTSTHYDSGEIEVRLDISADPTPEFTLDYTPAK
jgi:RimJ/RimL family protein N-acetyltransferase